MSPSSPRAVDPTAPGAKMAAPRAQTGWRARLRRDAQLVRMFSLREVRIRYRTSLLDVAWAVINPIVVLAVYGYILTQAFGVSTSGAPYLASTWAGLVVWTYFSTSMGGAITSVISASELVTKVYFPREVLPLAVVGATLADLAVGMVLLVVLCLVLGAGLSATALFAIVPLTILVLWTAALAVTLSVMAVYARDLVHAVHLALRVGFFATPVMYDSSALPSAIAWTARVNPLAASIEGLRAAFFGTPQLDWTTLGLQLAGGFVAFAVAVSYVQRAEGSLVDVL